MPNPHPVHRPRTPAPVVVPPGVRQRADGRWERRYRDPAGNRRSIYGPTLESVTGRDVDQLPERFDARLTLGAYLEGWLETLELRPNSIETHRGHVVRYLVPLLGGVRLAELDKPGGKRIIADAYRRLRARNGRPLSPRTIELAHATLRRALSQAVVDGVMRTNPARGLNPHGTAGQAMRSRRVGAELPIPSAAELRLLDAELEGHPWHPIFRVAVLAGLRQSETLGLRWSPDLAELETRRQLTVNGSLRRTDRTLDDPKTDASRRTIRVDAMLVDSLRAHRQAQRVRKLAAGTRWSNPADLVFTTRTGGPIQGRLVTRWYHAACDRAGLPRYRWHDLRHAYATGLLEHGVDLSLVSKVMGHASVAITADTYQHLTPAGRELVAETSGRALRR
jgi:integrase